MNHSLAENNENTAANGVSHTKKKFKKCIADESFELFLKGFGVFRTFLQVPGKAPGYNR